MFERFTDSARKAMNVANTRAVERCHEYITSEHILLGLAEGNSSVATSVLLGLGVDPQAVRAAIIKGFVQGANTGKMVRLPLDESAKLVVERTILASKNMNVNYAGTEHMLLGIASMFDTRAVKILGELMKHEPSQVEMAIHAETLRQLNGSEVEMSNKAAANEKPPEDKGKGPVNKPSKLLLHTIQLAQMEAGSRNHPKVEPEHFVLGVLKSLSGNACEALVRMHLDYETADEWLNANRPRLAEVANRPMSIPASDALLQSFAHGDAIASHFKHPEVYPDHVIMGMFREKDSGAKMLHGMMSGAELSECEFLFVWLVIDISFRANERANRKPIEQMTEIELRDMTQMALSAFANELPKDTLFACLFWPKNGQPGGSGQYGSNCVREDMIKAMREFADRLEKNDPDIKPR